MGTINHFGMGELGKVFVTELAGQFGWLAVGLALVPLCTVLVIHWFWKESRNMAVISEQISKLEGISSQRYLTRCSDILQEVVGDPITCFRKFLSRSIILYFILFIIAYYKIQIYNNEINISLKFPSKFDDFFEIFTSFFAGFLIYLFCMSQSILFLDLCKSSRSSLQVFFALVADVLLTFAAVAIFTGMVHTFYTWSIYSSEKRNVSLEIAPLGKMASEIKYEGELINPDEQDMTSLLRAMDAMSMSKKYPIMFAGILQSRSKELQKKENSEFETFFIFKGDEKPSEKIVIGHPTNFDSTIEIPLTQIVGRMVDQQNSCSPLLVQRHQSVSSLPNSAPLTVYVNANVTPNLKALDFGRMLRDAIGRQLQYKWQTIGSGFINSDASMELSDLRNSNILTEPCSRNFRNAKSIDQYRDVIFIQAYYNELHANRSPFWRYYMPSAYYAFACFSTSFILIIVMIGLLFVNFYNFSSYISNKIFSFSVFEDISSERRAFANAAILGAVIFLAVGIFRGLISLALG